MRIHTDEKLFQFNGCEKSFSNRSNLTVHKRKHTGEQPNQSDNCDKAFLLRSYLNGLLCLNMNLKHRFKRFVNFLNRIDILCLKIGMPVTKSYYVFNGFDAGLKSKEIINVKRYGAKTISL